MREERLERLDNFVRVEIRKNDYKGLGWEKKRDFAEGGWMGERDQNGWLAVEEDR